MTQPVEATTRTELDEPPTESTGAAEPPGSPRVAPDALDAANPAEAPVPPEPADLEGSPLSQRLGRVPEEATVTLASEGERAQIAKRRIGTSLKGYRLAKLLGVGSTTASYEAVKGAGDAGERVIVRTLLGDVATSARARSHFLRAAYAASRFTHPRTVPVNADGLDEDGVPFTIRPFHEAEPVSRFVRMNQPDEQRVLKMAEQLLDILEIAHAHGIVHGAISPENVLVTSRGSARLVDFSVPPGLGARRDDESPLPELRLGPYTAPERCAPPDQASATEQGDIWCVGAVMYFALTGKAPRGDTKGRAVLGVTKSKAVRDVKKDTSEPVANVIDHALAQEPSVRYDSAYAMLGDVRRVLAGRAPKLAQSSGPVPSGVLADSSGGPPSTFRPPPFRSPSGSPSSQREKGASQWKGNVTLIVLIAILLAVAAYVMFREKSEEHTPAPTPSSP